MVYLFGVIKKDGSRQFIKSNSANHAKQIRSRVIREKPLLISPIINADHHDKQLPAVFGVNLKKLKGVL